MTPALFKNRVYLGDGVYVGFDGFNIWLYTDDGIGITNQIALEPEVLKAFQLWLERTKESRSSS